VVITEAKEAQSKTNIFELSLENNNSHLKEVEAKDVLSWPDTRIEEERRSTTKAATKVYTTKNKTQ
jgi:hypothetical protein